MKLILFFFSDEPKLPLIPKIGPKPNIEKLFLQLSTCDDELLLTQKIITISALPLSKLHKRALSDVISYPPYTYFSLSLFFTILVAPNKQFLNLKLLVISKTSWLNS